MKYLVWFSFFVQAGATSFDAWVTRESVELPAKRPNIPTSIAEIIDPAASSPT